MAKKGSWVQIHNIVLKPEERTGKLPEDTKKAPLEMWVKGFLQTDAETGETVNVETVTGRVVSGVLQVESPVYTHGFGATCVPELLQIDKQLHWIMNGGEN